MRKILTILARDYKATVKTKGFLIGLAIAPLFMGGSFIAIWIAEKHQDTRDKRIAVVDRTDVIAPAIVEAAKVRNENVVLNEDGQKTSPAYLIEVIRPDDTNAIAQRLALSERVRQGRLHAFVEIDAGVIHPTRGTSDTDVRYYAKNPIMDDIRRWIGGPINEALRHQRLADAGIAASAVPDLFVWVNVRPEGLVTADVRTGEIQESTGASEVRAIAVPVAAVMLMFLLIMMGASPLITSVMEEKTQRIAEVLLGSVRPFQFMAGKLLGGVAVALTASAVYLGAGIAVAVRLGWTDYVPYGLLPWFFTYLVVAIVMIGAVYAALGSACSEARDAQSLSFPVLLPVLIPMFMLGPILKSPDGPLATALSFFPPCMPTMMLMRQSMPGGIPVWQPWAALGTSLAFTILMVWAGGRIFRVAILMQGTPPRWSNLIRWVIRG